RPGPFVEQVDVLGDHTGDQAASLQPDERAVPGVGPGAADVPPADVVARPVVASERLVADELLVGHRVAARGVRPAVGRDAGVGGDPGPGQHGDPRSREELDGVRHRSCTRHLFTVGAPRRRGPTGWRRATSPDRRTAGRPDARREATAVVPSVESMTTTTAAAAPPATRLHGLDSLRATALGLGIVLHSLAPFVPDLPWLFLDSRTTPLAGVTSFWIHLFRMVLFMLLAGYFGRMVVHRRGPRSYL